MGLIAIARPEFRPATAVAPWWHTGMVAGLFLVLAVLGSRVPHQTSPAVSGAQQHSNMIPTYVSLIAAEWALVYSIWKAGRGRIGAKLADLVGAIPRGAGLLREAGWGLLVFACWMLWQAAQEKLFPHRHPWIHTLLPAGGTELLLWTALAISAGICEEIVFRGYFQRQFEALTQSLWIAIVLQAVLFGTAHAYEGVLACTTIMVYGLVLGALAAWRRSLSAGIAAHVFSDVLPVLVLRTIVR